MYIPSTINAYNQNENHELVSTHKWNIRYTIFGQNVMNQMSHWLLDRKYYVNDNILNVSHF